MFKSVRNVAKHPNCGIRRPHDPKIGGWIRTALEPSNQPHQVTCCFRGTKRVLVSHGVRSRVSSGQENCDRVILVSSPTHLPRCLRDACSLWLDPQHQPPPRPGDATPSAGQHADVEGHSKQERLEEEEDGGDKARRRRQRRPWLPLVLASPSATSYAGYGPDDVAIVEPPHRGDHGWGRGDGSIEIGSRDPGSAPTAVFPGDSAGREDKEAEEGGDLNIRNSPKAEAEETATPLLLLHELVALALRVRRSSDEGFRTELQELLSRCVDIE